LDGSMTPNGGARITGRSFTSGPAAGLSRRRRAGLIAFGLVLAAGASAGCSFSDGVGPYLVDPGHYSVYHCKDLVVRLNQLQAREKELRNLMDKASEGGGGSVIGALSYRADYEKTLGDETVLRRTAAEKKCELGQPPSASSAAPASAAPAAVATPGPAPIYQSDQIIR
jgi:hypothetical protein